MSTAGSHHRRFDAARPAELASLGVHVEKGVFGADMEVSLVNDGPVTVWLETPGVP